jgi:hypothetical protein
LLLPQSRESLRYQNVDEHAYTPDVSEAMRVPLDRAPGESRSMTEGPNTSIVVDTPPRVTVTETDPPSTRRTSLARFALLATGIATFPTDRGGTVYWPISARYAMMLCVGIRC